MIDRNSTDPCAIRRMSFDMFDYLKLTNRRASLHAAQDFGPSSGPNTAAFRSVGIVENLRHRIIFPSLGIFL